MDTHIKLAKSETAYISEDDFRRKMGFSDVEWHVLTDFSGPCDECGKEASVSQATIDPTVVKLSCGHIIEVTEWLSGLTAQDLYEMFKDALSR